MINMYKNVYVTFGPPCTYNGLVSLSTTSHGAGTRFNTLLKKDILIVEEILCVSNIHYLQSAEWTM